MRCILTLLLLVCNWDAEAADPFTLMDQYRKIAEEKKLWPGFDLLSTPVAIYDGEQTLLFGHPHPPAEFQELPDHPGVWFYTGQHPDVRSNSSQEFGGISTATVLLSEKSRASLIVHEAFHVFQRAHHPKWSGDEGALFIYPVENPELLQLRQLEVESLRRALDTRNHCWAAEAMRLRKARYEKMSPDLALYERMTELNEGLAQYVENNAGNQQPQLPDGGFAADDIRTRCYSTGAAIAAILDRVNPDWIQKIEKEQFGSLDEILTASVSNESRNACSFTSEESQAAFVKAKTDIEAVQSKNARMRKDFLQQNGWQVIIVARKSPLWPQGFDPWNVQKVTANEILHTRWLKAGNESGTIEVLSRSVLTEAAGNHPLFDGIRKITISGLRMKPVIQETDENLKLKAEGLELQLAATKVQVKDQTVWIEILK